MKKKISGTEKLEKIIGKTNVDLYLRLYKQIKDIAIDTRGGLGYLIWVEVQKEIERKLQLLTYEGLISQEDVEDIWKYITHKMIHHNKGVRLLKAMGEVMLKEFGKGNKPQDDNRIIDVFIFMLVYDCKMQTKKPHFSLVGDFLDEQGICLNLVYKDVSRRYGRITEDIVISTLHVYDLFLDTPTGIKFIPDGLPERYDGFLNRVFYQD